MPLPLSKGRRLGDYDALWWLCVRCRCCDHSREIPAEFCLRLFNRRKLLVGAPRNLANTPTQPRSANLHYLRCRCLDASSPLESDARAFSDESHTSSSDTWNALRPLPPLRMNECSRTEVVA
jgi:hypothetical protein